MKNSENVRGPGKPFFPIAVVLLLTAGVWIGLWELHVHWYNPPRNPLGTVPGMVQH